MQLLKIITSKINRIILIFTLFVLGLSFYFVYTLNLSYTQKEAVQSLDTALQLSKNLLEGEQQNTLSLSLLLSQDISFLEAFYHDNREATFTIIKEKIESLKKLQGLNIDVQVHDKNLHTYLRSWDFNITDVPLASFRKGLVIVKNQKKPLVSIEVGKRLNIKAISPILKNGKFQGSIEVIEDFEHLREKLSEQGYILFVLLDKNYLSIATTLKNYPVLSKKYVVINHVDDQESLSALKNDKLSNLENYGYLMQENFSFGYFELKNFENKKLGYIVVGIKNSSPLSSYSYHEDVLFDQNDTEVIIR